MNKQEKITEAYYKLLSWIDWEDEVLIAGLREGLNKFLSNAHLKRSAKHKYLQGDFYSEAAQKQINNKNYSDLIHEHMVPKSKYIQKPCEESAKKGSLTKDFIIDLLNKYWKIAIITKDEDKRLAGKTMPNDWDEQDVLARYKKAGITLIKPPTNS